MEIPDEDDLLNFTLEGETATFSLETGSFPVFVEEELEWLSNKDAFPGVETCFGILSDNPELVLSHKSPISVLENSISSSSNSSIPIKYPVGARSKRRRRKTPELPSQQWLNKRRCLHCQADKTPQWRAGPMGPKTLCNACGVRYKSGRLLPEYRPTSSPTFSNVLHSNSHRKVVEMRKQKKQGVNEGCG